MKKIRLIIVDDHRLFRNGIKALLREMASIESIAEASNGLEFLDYMEHFGADMALMDINMPVMDGIEATRLGMERYPELKIIALSMLFNEEYYFKMVQAGVKGFILKDSGSEELANAVESVRNGMNYFSQDLLRNVIFRLSSGARTEISDGIPGIRFTGRELEVLEQICKGLSNQEIAEGLFISPRTVERHRANLFAKTGSKNSVNLVVYAIRHNLIKI